MKVSVEVLKWLKENAYAVEGQECWFLSDFPQNKIPDKLEIPMNKKSWKELKSIAL